MRNAVGLFMMLALLLAGSPVLGQRCQRSGGSMGQMQASGAANGMALRMNAAVGAGMTVHPGYSGPGVSGFPGSGGTGMSGFSGYSGNGFSGFTGSPGAGLNSRGLGAGYGTAGLGSSSANRGAAAAYRASRMQYRPTTQFATQSANQLPAARTPPSGSSQEVAVLRLLEDLSAGRPMLSGVVVQVLNRQIEVQYQDGGETRTATFPAREVFFFRANDEMANAAIVPGQLSPGHPVLVPQPETAQNPQASARAVAR
jgi:hypothetical protein